MSVPFRLGLLVAVVLGAGLALAFALLGSDGSRDENVALPDERDAAPRDSLEPPDGPRIARPVAADSIQFHDLRYTSFLVLDLNSGEVIRIEGHCRIECARVVRWLTSDTLEVDTGIAKYELSLPWNLRAVGPGAALPADPRRDRPDPRSSDGRWSVVSEPWQSAYTLSVHDSRGRERFRLSYASAGHLLMLDAPTWSPAGPALGFIGNHCVGVRVGSHIFTFEPEDSRLVQRTDGPEQVLAFSWSPDGKAIALGEMSHVNTRDAVVSILDVEAGIRRELVSIEEHALPVLPVAWSPDGSRLLLYQWGGGHRCFGEHPGETTLEVVDP